MSDTAQLIQACASVLWPAALACFALIWRAALNRSTNAEIASLKDALEQANRMIVGTRADNEKLRVALAGNPDEIKAETALNFKRLADSEHSAILQNGPSDPDDPMRRSLVKPKLPEPV